MRSLLVKDGWVYKETKVLSDPSDPDRLFLEVETELTDLFTLNAYPVKAMMKIYSNEYAHLREYITKNSAERVNLLRTDGGALCIMIDISYRDR